MAVDLGDQYRCAFTLKSPAGDLMSSTAMTLTITLPDGSALTPLGIVPSSTGVYIHDHLTTTAGRHVARWVGSGANPGAHTEIFDVRPAALIYMISLAEAKAQINQTSTVDDEELRHFVEAATLKCEELRGEAIVRRTFTEVHKNVRGSAALDWPSPEITLQTVAATNGLITWNVADLVVSPSGVVTAKQGPDLWGDLNFVYASGYQIIPANFTLACKLLIQRAWATQRGDKGAVHPGGQELSIPYSAVTRQVTDWLGSGIGGIA